MIVSRAVPRRVLSLICVVAAPVTVAACGNEERRPSPGPVGSPQNPVAARAAPGATEPSGRAARESGAAAHPSYDRIVGSQERRPRERLSPCNLVTKTQAQAILGASILPPREALQGPTCIYETRRPAKFVTMAVQSADIAALKPQLRRVQPVTIAAKRGYCGRLGQPVLYVPLGGSRVLTIAAECGTAQRFAKTALPRLQR